MFLSKIKKSKLKILWMSTLACKVVATDKSMNCLYSQKKHILKLFFHFQVQFLTEITNIEVKVMIKLSEMRWEGKIEEEAAITRFQIWSSKIELLKLYCRWWTRGVWVVAENLNQRKIPNPSSPRQARLMWGAGSGGMSQHI